MPRKKRSEKIAEVAVRERPVPSVAPPKAAMKVFGAICPVCGRTLPEDRAVKIGYITVGRTPYFETIQWDENKPFGVVFEASGRGSFQEWQHISPEEAPELFKAVKERFLEALREWVVVKKWITQDELETVSIARSDEVDRMRIQADNK